MLEENDRRGKYIFLIDVGSNRPTNKFLPTSTTSQLFFDCKTTMDAHALLTSQGWRGSGHSLHSTSDAIGLSRPLLVAQKQNVLGLGKKQHRTSDMWWMNAFDKSLKGLDTSNEGHVVQTVTNGGLDMVKKGGGKWVGKSGLYASFVKGEMLGGTLTPEDASSNPEDGQKLVGLIEVVKSKKQRNIGETKEERRARKLAKRAAKEDIMLEIEPALASAAGQIPLSKADETEAERRELKRRKKGARSEEKPGKVICVETNKKRRSKDRESS